MGAAHARAFHREGANVVLTDVQESGRELADELGARAAFKPLDVTDEAAWSAVIEAAESEFGPVSVLVNNAGIIEQGETPIETYDASAWRRIIDVNLVGQYLGIKFVVPSMRRAGGGSIINVSSVGGFSVGAGLSAYVASKWGIRGLTKTAAVELGRDNIRVNSIHPGITDTPMHAKNQSSVAGKPMPDQFKTLAVARVADPDEISQMVMYLASSASSFSTGAEFIVDGGYLLGPALRYAEE
jgi:3alpha(or 20beta)-hydroxysteroid dehydrogenase